MFKFCIRSYLQSKGPEKPVGVPLQSHRLILVDGSRIFGHLQSWRVGDLRRVRIAEDILAQRCICYSQRLIDAVKRRCQGGEFTLPHVRSVIHGQLVRLVGIQILGVEGSVES